PGQGEFLRGVAIEVRGEGCGLVAGRDGDGAVCGVAIACEAPEVVALLVVERDGSFDEVVNFSAAEGRVLCEVAPGSGSLQLLAEWRAVPVELGAFGEIKRISLFECGRKGIAKQILIPVRNRRGVRVITRVNVCGGVLRDE